MEYGCIYIIRNSVNEKVYVGKTTRNVNERLREHRSRLKKRNSKPFYQELIKDGVKELFIETVEDNIPIPLLLDREKHYMDKYNSLKEGYNHFKGTRLDLPTSELIDLYAYGMALEEIGNLYNVDKSVIKHRLTESGVTIKDWNSIQRIEGLTKETLYDLYVMQQLTTPAIAKMFNTSSTTVQKRLKKYDIPTRKNVNR